MLLFTENKFQIPYQGPQGHTRTGPAYSDTHCPPFFPFYSAPATPSMFWFHQHFKLFTISGPWYLPHLLCAVLSSRILESCILFIQDSAQMSLSQSDLPLNSLHFLRLLCLFIYLFIVSDLLVNTVPGFKR